MQNALSLPHYRSSYFSLMLLLPGSSPLPCFLGPSHASLPRYLHFHTRTPDTRSPASVSCRSGPARQHFYAFMVTDTWKPPKVSTYRQEELRFDRAAGAAVAAWAAEQPGLATIRGNHQVRGSGWPPVAM